MSFKYKIMMFFGLFLALFVGSAGVSYYSLNQINENVSKLYNEDLNVVEKVLQADRDLHQALVAERSYFLTKDKNVRAKLRKSHKENIQQARDRGAYATKRPSNPKVDGEYAKYTSNLETWARLSEEMLNKLDSGLSQEEFEALESVAIGSLDEKFGVARDPIDIIEEEIISEAKAKMENGIALFERAMAVMFGVFALGILVFVYGMYNLNSSVVTKLLEGVRSLTESNLKISEHTSDLNQSSANLATASNQQNAASHESVSAMEEMSSMVDQTHNYVQGSIENLKEVNGKIHEGKGTLSSLVNSMEEINQSTEKIRDVEKIIEMIAEKTSIINDIVFKTQLLSFNASIEAARAGQHGRGFSVVAEEVSQLATVSGNAAQEIQELLNRSQEQVSTLVVDTSKVTEQGKEVTGKVEVLFNGIDQLINGINEQVDGVSVASKEQRQGITQTLEAMNQLNMSTQETSSVSTELDHKGEQLTKLNHSLAEVIGSLEEIAFGKNLHMDIPSSSPIKSPKFSKLPTKMVAPMSSIDSEDEVSSDDDSFQHIA